MQSGEPLVHLPADLAPKKKNHDSHRSIILRAISYLPPPSNLSLRHSIPDFARSMHNI
jgi:hypothetical protein